MPGYELINQEEKQAVDDIFDKGGVLYRYGLADKRQNIFRVDEFEKAISQKVASSYCLAVCNGTAALKLALFALGVGKADEVITQSFTFIATAEAILELGAKPVITEIDKSLNMDPADLEKKISNKTKAIIPVHMAGVPAKMAEIIAISQRYNIPILEDACQALGATYQGKYLGTLGEIGAFSLDIGKVITTGEGGLLVTNDKNLYLKAREYSDHGHECNPNVPRGEDTRSIWGFNYKITELQGAVGLAQLKKLDYILKIQRQNKQKIKQGISHIPNIEFRELPDEKGDAGDTLIFFVANKEKALKFASILKENGLGTKNLPDALNWHFAGAWSHIFAQAESQWPQSDNLIRRAVAIPILVKMNDEQIEKITKVIHEASQKI